MTQTDRTIERLSIVLAEFLPSGGMFQFTFQLADALARAGHRVTLLTGPDPELRSDTAGLTVLEIFPTWHPNASQPGGPALLRKVRRLGRALRLLESWRRTLLFVRRTRPNVVQFGELRFVLDMVAFWLVARLGGAGATVDFAHNPLPYDVNGKESAVEKGGRLVRFLLGRAYGAADLVLVLGNKPQEQLLAHFPQVRRTAVCGHGDYTGVLAGHTLPSPSAAGPAALFFGAWTKYKNLPLLLDAFARVRDVVPGARLTLAGPVMPDVDLTALTARANEIGQVDLRPGYVAMEDLPALFADHRAVMFTYETVNISGSVHMAYTFGRPVIATAVGAMTDVVRHEVTGLVVSSTAEAVAEAMGRLLTDDAGADRMGAAARHTALDSASWTAVADRATDAYRGAVPPFAECSVGEYMTAAR